MDFNPSAAFNFTEEETDQVSSFSRSSNDLINHHPLNTSDKKLIEYSSSNLAAFDEFEVDDGITGFEAVLGGELREKAVWVDESNCIGCQYCVHVASNTFIVDEELGRARVIRQNGDNIETVKEAMDTCPVDCMHWVDFEDLEKLDSSLNRDMFQSLGKLPRVNRY